MTTEPDFDGTFDQLLREAYFADSHLWVLSSPGGSAHCGFDPLGVETSGDIVALSFEPVGSRIERGEAFGSIEAAKFVGPLIAPVSGTLAAHNEAVLAQPALLHDDSARHWLVRIDLADADNELAGLRHGEEAVRSWLESESARFKQQGMIAE